MPGKIKVKVLAGRNLPVMDRAGDTTDAFVEIKFGGVTHKTDVCRKSLNPQWNSTEWYRFEVDESELQDEPLQLRLMDHDTYSANDAIGKVVISLAPLLAREVARGDKGGPNNGAVMSGWIPVFDTMHGIRGELNVIVKVELFSDFNKYKTSSVGVQFFHCPMIPPGYRASAIHGFVEELVMNDDPEYQWIDKIRTPRASNEARQVAFIKLSNQVQRLVGLKAAELGANAVVGYQQDFDLEGEAGVVARAIGTAVSIEPLPTPSQPITMPPCTQQERSSPKHSRHDSCGGREANNATSTPLGMHRRSSDSDLSITPKGSSLNASTGVTGSGGGAILRPSMNTNNLDMLEYPFLTMTEFPPGFIVHIGGMVSARSVKLIGAGGEAAARAAGWAELRTEMRAHARTLRCAAVVGYRETAAICEEVCVLSASGTAAVINLDCDFNLDVEYSTTQNLSKSTIEELEQSYCGTAHVPYSPDKGPYKAELQLCGACRRARVPAVLLATCSKPSKLATYGKTIPITACAAKIRRAPPTSEPGARDISDQLPFLEYELHKMLLAKLRMQGANAVFELRTEIAVGERCVLGIASGAAVRLCALPASHPPTVKASENDKEAIELQKALWDTFAANKIANGYDVGPTDHNTNGSLTETDGEELPALDLCVDKDACILELDETEDVETARHLATRRANMELYTNNLRAVPGAPPQAFAQVWRARLHTVAGVGSGLSARLERHASLAFHAALYKLRRLRPAALAAPVLQLDTPDDEIQLVISGTAVPLETRGAGDAEEGVFALDEESEGSLAQSGRVAITSLPCVAGARASRRVCGVRALFVRETTCVRELGGLSGFLHTFTSEVFAIVRAYTAALGGNALTSFYITQLMLQDNAHKNQGQCLLSVGGDVVHVTY